MKKGPAEPRTGGREESEWAVTSVEKTAKSVDEAVELALKELGVPKDAVAVEILEDKHRTGPLGIFGQTVAKVRVTLKGRTEEPAPEVAETIVEEPAQEPTVAVQGVPLTAEAQPPEESEEGEEYEESEQPRDAIDDALDLLDEILELMDVDAVPEVVEEGPDRVLIELSGSDLGVLIGKHGRTLNALQYLTNLILGRIAEERIKVVLDAKGYRARREKALERMALRAAENARRRGQKVRLEALRAQERRIIHLTLKEDPSVITYSEGEEPYRYVVVAPAGREERRPPESHQQEPQKRPGVAVRDEEGNVEGYFDTEELARLEEEFKEPTDQE